MQIYYFLNEDHSYRPCSNEEWGSQFSNFEKRCVSKEKVNEWEVSTIWFGLNMNIFSQTNPLVFETMVFKDDNYIEIYHDRYSTWDEAVEGHQKAIEWVKNGCKENSE
jgi:hypothetical protein